MIKSALAVTIGIVIVMSTAVTLIPIKDAEGHGVQAQLQSRFVRIQDEAFSAQNLQTGEELTVTGTLQSLVNRPLRAWISLLVNPLTQVTDGSLLQETHQVTYLCLNLRPQFHTQ